MRWPNVLALLIHHGVAAMRRVTGSAPATGAAEVHRVWVVKPIVIELIISYPRLAPAQARTALVLGIQPPSKLVRLGQNNVCPVVLRRSSWPAVRAVRPAKVHDEILDALLLLTAAWH